MKLQIMLLNYVRRHSCSLGYHSNYPIFVTKSKIRKVRSLMIEANLHLIYKVGDATVASNYRPVSFRPLLPEGT